MSDRELVSARTRLHPGWLLRDKTFDVLNDRLARAGGQLLDLRELTQ